MKKINFTNATVTAQASVEIDGVSHDVTPAVIEGGTLPTPDNINQLQANVEECFNGETSMGKIRVEDIECKNLFNLHGDYTITNDGSPTITENSITLSSSDGNGGYTKFSQLIPVSGVLTLSATISNGSGYARPLLIPLDSSKNVITNLTIEGYTYNATYKGYFKDCSDGNYSLTLNFPENVKYLQLGFVHIVSTFTNIQIEKGSTATSYTSYKKYGYNSQESMGSIVVDDIRCKNLLNENGDIVIDAIGFPIDIKAGKTYTFSSNLPIYWIKISDNRDSNYNGAEYYNTTGYAEYTFTCTKSYPYIFIGINQDNPYSLPTSLLDYANYKFQLEEGSTATSYTPYKNFNNTDNGWVDIELANTYSFFDLTAYNGLQYKKIDNQVFVRGMLVNSVANPAGYYASCGFLPEECRPKKPVYLLCSENGEACNCTVETDGGIRVYNKNANSWIALDAMRFFID